MTSAKLHFINFTQLDEGNDWTNTVEFLSEIDARAAALALCQCKAAYKASVTVYDDSDKKIARYEYNTATNDVTGKTVEHVIFDDHAEPLFKISGKLGA